MGDSQDGSSNAAPSAQPLGQTHKSSGFFGRIVEALSPNEAEAGPETGTQPVQAPRTHGMMNLRRMRVEDVAIPMADIVAVPGNISKDELVRVFHDSGMSRLPVYEGTLDTPLGFIHLKDFALKHGFSAENGAFDLAAMLRPLLYVPPSMPIGVLLAKMQAGRRHMALVIDEYGGVDGLVTIEDLIEQVIGEIEDEHDVDEDKLWLQEDPGTYLAQAKAPLDEFQSEVGRDLTSHAEVDTEEVDTLGGLVFMLSGNVPARGEVVTHPDGTEFEIVDADPRRIKRLRVRFADAHGG